MICTRNKSGAEILSLKDDDLSKSCCRIISSFTAQKLDRRKLYFHALPPPPPSMVKIFWLMRMRGGLRCWVPKAVLLCTLVRNRNTSRIKKKNFIWLTISVTSEIRGAKTRLFLLCDPTLTSSASTNHIRRSLQALSFPASDDRLCTLRANCSNLDVVSVSSSTNGKGRKKEKEKRGQLFGYWMGRRVLILDVVEVLGGVDRDIIVVYVDDVFVRLDGLVPLIIHFRVDLISVYSPLIIFYCRHSSFHFGF